MIPTKRRLRCCYVCQRIRRESSWCLLQNVLALLIFVLILSDQVVVTATVVFPGEETREDYSFVAQPLGSPFDGHHSGVAVIDLNLDGYNDILFSAGRHNLDQSFAMINLGLIEDVNGNIIIQWSDALRVGPVGGYYQVDAYAGLSSLPEGHIAVLLAGGSSSRTGVTPALLLDLEVTGCSVDLPDNPCSLQWTIIWEDPNPQRDRNGALAPTITNLITRDPAIVLTSSACTAIYLPDNMGVYGNTTYVLSPDEKDPNEDGNVARAAGLAVGYVGKLPGVVAGARTEGTRSPAPPLVAIVQMIEGDNFYFDYFIIDQGTEYQADRSVSLQPVGVVLDDWNGDNSFDIGVVNFLERDDISTIPIPQWYYELQTRNETNDVSTAFKIDRNAALRTVGVGGRSIDSGIVFPNVIQAGTIESNHDFPDIVIGSADSSIHFLANIGIDDQTGKSLGFEELYTYDLPGTCQVRDVLVAELKPCYMSVVCSVDCSNTLEDPELLGNFVLYSRLPYCQTSKPSIAPSTIPSHTPSLRPSLLPSLSPSKTPSSDPSLMPSSVPSATPTNSQLPTTLSEATSASIMTTETLDPDDSSSISRVGPLKMIYGNILFSSLFLASSY